MRGHARVLHGWADIRGGNIRRALRDSGGGTDEYEQGGFSLFLYESALTASTNKQG